MVISVLSVIGGLVCLYFGGEWLVKGAVELAERMGISPLAVGLIVVGFGTSMPELVTSLQAALSGAPDIAWGNIVGSNIANSVLILGAAIVAAPLIIGADGLRRDTVFGVVAAGLLAGMALYGRVGMWAGAAMLMLLLAYLAYAYREETAEPEVHTAAYDKGAAKDLTLNHARNPQWARPAGYTVIGLAALVLGGRFLVGGAVTIAETIGLSQAVIGLTIVAIGTSLPEMVTSVVAARRGQGEIALGNIAGSNVYNILGIGGATAIASPGVLPPAMVGFDMLVMLGSAILLTFLVFTRTVIGRVFGAVLLVLYAAYLIVTVLNSA